LAEVPVRRNATGHGITHTAIRAVGRDRAEQLKDIADLRAQSALSEEEFAAEKARILGTWTLAHPRNLDAQEKRI
jgi:hypothetical protein